MSMTRRPLLLILALMVAALGPAAKKVNAADELDLYLVMSMAGVTAGSVKLSIDDQDSRTVSKLAMKSKGMFKFLTGYKSKATAHSTGGVEGVSPMPLSYISTYKTKNTERRVEIGYDGETGEIDTFGSWKFDKPRKPKVPAALQTATVDPLTAMVRFRHWIRELRSGAGIQKVGTVETAPEGKILDVFDGRRRYRLQIELLERLEVDYDGRDVPALRFRVDMKALAGFSEKDMLANWASEDGQRWIEVIVTDDDNPIPLSMATIGGTLKTSVYLRKICRGDDKCTKISG